MNTANNRFKYILAIMAGLAMGGVLVAGLAAVSDLLASGPASRAASQPTRDVPRQPAVPARDNDAYVQAAREREAARERDRIFREWQADLDWRKQELDHERAAARMPTADAQSVTYEVSADGTGNVTYSTGGHGMNITQDTAVSLPWSAEMKTDSQPLAMIAQHTHGSGPIACRITADGRIVAENSSNGQYAVVSCAANTGS